MSTTMLKGDLGTGDLCDNIGLVGVSAKWSYVTASPSHHDQAIPILSPLYVGHPLFKIRRLFDLLVNNVMMMPSSTTCHHTQDGESALMVAASEGRTAVVQEVVKSGATLDIQTVVYC